MWEVLSDVYCAQEGDQNIWAKATQAERETVQAAAGQKRMEKPGPSEPVLTHIQHGGNDRGSC